MKIILSIIILVLLKISNANAKNYGSLIDSLVNPKDHSYCSKVAKNIDTRYHTASQWYQECRLQLDVFGSFNWKMDFAVHDDSKW
tara:strand:- start:914 stop:1168 length:255 start_codon:yes stop_codon:yes gene_type:complete